MKIYNYSFLKSFLIWWLILPLILNSCSLFKPIRKTVIEYKTEYVVKDSISIRDSVRITDKERVVDVVAVYDTLHLETSLASSKTWVDTTLHMLKGSIENKDKIVEHIKYVDKWHTKDSLVYEEKEVPVPVDKIVKVKYIPGYVKGLATVGLVSIFLIIAFILKKLRLF